VQYYSGLLEAHTDIIVMRGRRNNIVLNFYKLYEAARTPLQTVLNIFDIYDDKFNRGDGSPSGRRQHEGSESAETQSREQDS